MKFLADSMLGKLSKWLRICGFNVIYVKDSKNKDLYFQAQKEERILLTRDNKYKNLKTIKVCFINFDNSAQQLKQLFGELSIKQEDLNLFSRCLVCNQILKVVDKNFVIDKLPPYVAKTKNEFSLCEECGRIYWSGTHYDRMLHKIKTDEIF